MSDQPPPTDDEVEQRLRALKGEVVDDPRRSWSSRGSTGGGSGAPRSGPSAGPGVRAVSWSVSQAQAGRLGLWIGLALVAFGGYLVLAELVPGIALAGSAVLAVVGGILVAWHVTGRAGSWALYAGAVLAGFGAIRLAAGLASLPAAGWGTLGAGLGLLAIAVRRAIRGGGIGWQAWIGGALAVFGGWGAVGAAIPGFPTLGDLIVPVVLLLIGATFLRRGFR